MTCPTCGTTDYARCDRWPTPCRRVRVVDDPADIGRIVGREVHWICSPETGAGCSPMGCRWSGCRDRPVTREQRDANEWPGDTAAECAAYAADGVDVIQYADEDESGHQHDT